MSKENVKLLFSNIEKNVDLKKKYVELIQMHQKEAENKFFDKLIEFGKTSGFVFSKDDIMTVRAECKDLSDDQLNNVAGGCYNTGGITGFVRF